MLKDGWIALGDGFPNVWADPDKRAVYNSVYPPDEDGNPRPFAAAGARWDELSSLYSAPTTRGSDRLRVKLEKVPMILDLMQPGSIKPPN